MYLKIRSYLPQSDYCVLRGKHVTRLQVRKQRTYGSVPGRSKRVFLYEWPGSALGPTPSPTQ
jgi:hypothetical protein